MLHRVSRIIYSNNPVRAFILAITVALLQPTNFLCHSTHATDSTIPGGLCDTCASQHSQSSYIHGIKSKNCAHKHIVAPGGSGTLGPPAPCGANRCAWTKDHPELCLTASSATEGSHAPHEAAAAPRVQGMYQFAKHCSRSTRSCRRRRRGQGSAGGGSRGTQGRRSYP